MAKKTSKKSKMTAKAMPKKTATRPAAKKAAAARTSSKPAAKPARPKKSSGALTMRSAAPSLTVGDIEKSLAWYRDVLGFSVGERWEDGGTLQGVMVEAGTVTFMLGQDDWKMGRDRVKGQGMRLYCMTDQNIDQIAERIKAAGGTLAQEPRDEWNMRALGVVDPDGFKITIAADLKKK